MVPTLRLRFIYLCSGDIPNNIVQAKIHHTTRFYKEIILPFYTRIMT